MPQKSKTFIIDIIPITKIPLSRNQSFCYIHNEKLPPGTLVSIPLFKRKVEGIVVNSRCDFSRLGNIKLKNIEKILENDFLTEEQLQLAEFISEYYISPLGIVMKGFVPKRVKIRNYACRQDKYPAKNSKHSVKKIFLTEPQIQAVDKISANRQPPIAKYLLFGPAASGKTEVYIHSILKIRKNNREAQFLILVPEQTLTPQALERYSAYFESEETVLLTSNITKSQYYSNWKKIKSGQAKIIIGTRMAVFAPFRKLGLVVIDEEQDMSYKQWDMNPRYDARTVAKELANLHRCPIVLGSATPRVESHYKAVNKKQKYQLILLPRLNLGSFSETSLQLVDMRHERWKGNLTTISKKLESEIAYALRNKQQVILFINRQGMSSFSVCAKCKTVLKCPFCDRALIYDRKKIYRCPHCSYKTSELPECPNCHNWEFKNVGLGTQKVEQEAIYIFPEARIARLDSQVAKNNKMYEKIYREFSEGKTDILVGTQMVTKGWDLPEVSLIGIIDMDNMLSIPDFFASERAFQYVAQVSGRVNRPGARFPGMVIIQTFQPENRAIKEIASLEYPLFYKKEIEERKSLRLPPWGHIIKLIFQDYSLKRAEAEIDNIYQELKNNPLIQVSEPQDAYVPKIRGRYRKQLTIKFRDKRPKKLVKILKSLSQGWIIDIDPISII